jgi:hypothetical protein
MRVSRGGSPIRVGDKGDGNVATGGAMDGSAIATRARAPLAHSGCFCEYRRDVGECKREISSGGSRLLGLHREDAAFAFPSALVSHRTHPRTHTPLRSPEGEVLAATIILLLLLLLFYVTGQGPHDHPCLDAPWAGVSRSTLAAFPRTLQARQGEEGAQAEVRRM